MSRTLDPVAHEAQRQMFITTAHDLVLERGFSRVSLNEIIAASGGSKGAFYHYFTSKADIIRVVVEQMVAQTANDVATIVSRPDLDAADKFARVVHAMPAGQSANRELLQGLLEVWNSDENAALRSATRQSSINALRGPLATLISDGVREGTFDVSSAVGAADVLACLLLDMSDASARVWSERKAGTISLRDAESVLDSYARAIERVLAAPQGTFPQNRALVRSWLG